MDDADKLVHAAINFLQAPREVADFILFGDHELFYRIQLLIHLLDQISIHFYDGRYFLRGAGGRCSQSADFRSDDTKSASGFASPR